MVLLEALLLLPVFCSAPAQALPAHVDGFRLIVNGAAMHLKGANWNPVPKGAANEPDFKQFADIDSALMSMAGINVIKTYQCITDHSVLDIFWARGIQVLQGVYSNANTPFEVIPSCISSVKDHPAVLMWVVGNEWNFNHCYAGLSFERCQEVIMNAVKLVRQHDRSHPVASVYGEKLPWQVFNYFRDAVDIWGINMYRGLTFGDLFSSWRSYGGPMFLAEYGADAFDSLTQREDQTAQAYAVAELTRTINQHSSIIGGVCLGGIFFAWVDEWWKDSRGSPWVHDTGGVAPGGGPYPDAVYNEEWWGLVTIDRNQRKAFWSYAALTIPMPSSIAEGHVSTSNASSVVDRGRN
eukprot:TRINITY_DN92967_c0_g1_i1.p1 TRINITY_DN92967_c0_g1~~TRINITY_DN92967_c0_g1_i1.p1  ORF type:complete len:352 (-),score=51.41 TRINITY_DN92967_c0_g1_i1:5-1060(-)